MTGNRPLIRTHFRGQFVELGNHYRICRVSRTNKYTFFYPASMVHGDQKLKLGA